jgi:hypothetical protein
MFRNTYTTIFFETSPSDDVVQLVVLVRTHTRHDRFSHLVILLYGTRNRLAKRQLDQLRGVMNGSPYGPALYEARRRTMALCNLFPFVIFTLWPCMPLRFLRNTSIEGPEGIIAKSFGFVDTVYGKAGAASVWTQNHFWQSIW